MNGKILFKLLIVLVIITQLLQAKQNKSLFHDPLHYVDPIIGVDGGGNVFPGAALPFSMVNVSPDVTQTGSPAGYSSNTPIVGFSHNHMSGMGMKSGFGNLLVFPQIDSIRLNDCAIVEDEFASPGYYRATLTKSKIKVEVTLSAKSGVHQYTFPKGKTARILLNFSSTTIGYSSKCIAAEARFISNNRVEGQASFEYIQAASLNGKLWNKAWFQHKDIINGAEMVLEMGSKPLSWGTNAPIPPSASNK